MKYGSELPPAEQAVLIGSPTSMQTSYINPCPLTLSVIGTLSWAVTVIAAAVALSQAGAQRTATIPLALAGAVEAIDHAASFGPVAMLLFIIAASVLGRARTARTTSDMTRRT